MLFFRGRGIDKSFMNSYSTTGPCREFTGPENDIEMNFRLSFEPVYLQRNFTGGCTWWSVLSHTMWSLLASLISQVSGTARSWCQFSFFARRAQSSSLDCENLIKMWEDNDAKAPIKLQCFNLNLKLPNIKEVVQWPANSGKKYFWLYFSSKRSHFLMYASYKFTE